MQDGYDINAEINGATQHALIMALGTLTFQNIQNGARADALARALGGMENSYAALLQNVEELRAEIGKTVPPEDLSKLSFEILETELKHRGYYVSAEPRTLEEATPFDLEVAIAEADEYAFRLQTHEPGAGPAPESDLYAAPEVGDSLRDRKPAHE